jgi:hypothetical protein
VRAIHSKRVTFTQSIKSKVGSSKIFRVQAAAFNDAFQSADGDGFAAVHGHNHLPSVSWRHF